MSQITTHVLDTARGLPAENMTIVLSKKSQEQWQEVSQGITNTDGRLAVKEPLPAGSYRMRFETDAYLKQHVGESFYPYVDVVFTICNEEQHFHIPLLLSPYGYSTYRGS